MITCQSCDKYSTIQVEGYENGRLEINDLKNVSDKTKETNPQIKKSDFIKEIKNSLFPHVGPVTSISFGLIDEVPYFITAGADGKLFLWSDLNGSWSKKMLTKCNNPITSACFSNDSSLIAYAEYNGMINFIRTDHEEFIRDDNLKIETGKVGIHQICFILTHDLKRTVESFVIIDPDGEMEIRDRNDTNRSVQISREDSEEDFDNSEDYPNDKYSKIYFKCNFSKSYVKGITPLNYCYIAAVCFGDIVRVFDINMLTLSEIKIKFDYQFSSLKNSKETDDEIAKTCFVNDSPIFGLKWQESLRKLFVLTQKQLILPLVPEAEPFIAPKIDKEEFAFTKDTLNSWTMIQT